VALLYSGTPIRREGVANHSRLLVGALVERIDAASKAWCSNCFRASIGNPARRTISCG